MLLGLPGSSAGKGSACNSVPGSGRPPPGGGIGYHSSILELPSEGSDGKESACNEGDLGSVPGLERSPGEGHGNQLQILAWKIARDRKATVPWCLKESDVAKLHSTAQKCSRRKFNLHHFPSEHKRKGINIYRTICPVPDHVLCARYTLSASSLSHSYSLPTDEKQNPNWHMMTNSSLWGSEGVKQIQVIQFPALGPSLLSLSGSLPSLIQSGIRYDDFSSFMKNHRT